MRRNSFLRCVLRLIIALTAFQFSVTAQPGEPPKDSEFYEKQAIQAYRNKDFAAFLENMKQAELLRPNNPRLLYNLADAFALNGKKDEAIVNLTKLAAMKLFYEPEKDDDFSSLKTTKEFQAVLKKFQVNKMPTGSGATAFTVREKGLVTEGLAYDDKTKTFYLGSVAEQKILSVNQRGETKVFVDRSSGLWSVFGMKVDAKHRLLWATTAAHKLMPNLKEGEDGKSGIFAFDLKTGKLVKKCLFPSQSPPHLLSDLTVAPNGDVYATDSFVPIIYVLRRGKNEIEEFLGNKEFVSLQGLDFTADGKFLFVADYAKGVFKINVATKETVNLAPPQNATLLGIDGMYFDGRDLIAVQNGITPQRVARLRLSKDFNQIVQLEILEANNPAFDDLTLGVLVKNQFYFVANSQWNLLGSGGKFTAPDKLQDVRIVKVAVD